MTRALILAVLLLASCANRAPAGFVDYCERHPERAECGGAK